MTREEAAKTLTELWGVDYRYCLGTIGVEAVDMAVEALKEEPRPTAHWEEVSDMWGDSLWRCDHCGIEWTFIEGTPKDNETKYCPNCGARMEEN